MGATASRSTPVVTTTRIHGYSTLRSPQTFDTIVFRGLPWNVKVYPHWDGLHELGLADRFIVSIEIDHLYHGSLIDSGLRTKISVGIEILDETGEHTVFQDGNYMPWWTGSADIFMFCVSRRELEASSCVHNGSFTVRSIMTMKQQAAKRNLSESKEPAALETMSGSHTLIISSFSKLKATLRDRECAWSPCFTLGGCTWFLKVCPNDACGFASLFLGRASKPDERPTTAEFSFELEGMVNFQSDKMTHTFYHANHQPLIEYELEPLSSFSAMHDDCLLVRCHLAIVVPPAAVPIQAVVPSIESVLTPLLSAMYD